MSICGGGTDYNDFRAVGGRMWAYLSFALLSAAAFALFVSARYETKLRLTRSLKNALTGLKELGPETIEWLISSTPEEKQTLTELARRKVKINPDIKEAIAQHERVNSILNDMRIWIEKPTDTSKWEDQCVDVLRKHLTFLYPEIVPTSYIYGPRNTLSTILPRLFPDFDAEWIKTRAKNYEKFCPDIGGKPDLCGTIRIANSTLGISASASVTSIFVVEAKKPSVELTDEWVDQAFNYANDIRRLCPDDMPLHFVCIAVAGPRKGIVKHVRWCSTDTISSISVTPITWDELYVRACSLAGKQNTNLLGSVEELEARGEPIPESMSDSESTPQPVQPIRLVTKDGQHFEAA